MKRPSALCLLCLMMTTLGGCVMKSTYDAAVQDAELTKAELERAREEQKFLARQATEIERQNRETMREAEAAAAAAQQAKLDIERERRQAEDLQAKLKQKLAQLARQQSALKNELVVAKENHAALQELVEVYQKKLRDQGGSLAAAAPLETTRAPEPFNPATLPPPNMEPIAKPAPAPPPAAPAEPPVAAQPPPAPKPQEPAESGWLSAIKDWVVSLWRSVFS